jgi:hypothetical protein
MEAYRDSDKQPEHISSILERVLPLPMTVDGGGGLTDRTLWPEADEMTRLRVENKLLRACAEALRALPWCARSERQNAALEALDSNTAPGGARR